MIFIKKFTDMLIFIPIFTGIGAAYYFMINSIIEGIKKAGWTVSLIAPISFITIFTLILIIIFSTSWKLRKDSHGNKIDYSNLSNEEQEEFMGEYTDKLVNNKIFTIVEKASHLFVTIICFGISIFLFISLLKSDFTAKIAFGLFATIIFIEGIKELIVFIKSLKK